jgi:hypothetical protein
MSIFESIKNAIFGHSEATASSGGTPGSAASPAVKSGASPGSPQASAVAPGTSASPPAGAPVNVEAVLNSLAQKSGHPSNWQTSIVDLMKLVDLDPSLQNRKQLAQELGYKGDTADSASMNIWLHKQVMTKLAENGGQVPASLRNAG